MRATLAADSDSSGSAAGGSAAGGNLVGFATVRGELPDYPGADRERHPANAKWAGELAQPELEKIRAAGDRT